LAASALVVATTVARAQPAEDDPIGALLAHAVQPPDVSRDAALAQQSVSRPISSADQGYLLSALSAAKRGDIATARAAIAAIEDRVAKKTATWALVDANADSLSFFEVDAARRELDGFPRPGRRQAAAEKLLETSGKSPSDVVAWFAGQQPTTAQGAMALASAYRTLGRQAEAADLIKTWWRNRSFEADVQRNMLSRFADLLTVDDHVRRADILLYGSQGPAARDMVTLLPADAQPAALVRIAFRSDARNADDLYDALTPEAQASPGVAFERAAWLRRKGEDGQAMALLNRFPKEVVTPEAADRMWDERHRLTLSAIRSGDWRSAYQASANSGVADGADGAEAEFYAGWIALNRLNEPAKAATHFAAIERIGSSPITRGRASHWEGRAAEAQGLATKAQAFYAEGAQYVTTFYGQLCAEKLGQPLVLPPDPVATDAERKAFERKDAVQAMRLLADQGQRDLFRAFALHLDDVVPTRVEAALLVDAIRGYGDMDISMRAARAAAQRNLILADRGYPYRTPPDVTGGAETAFVLAITRQESGFDPGVRSGADARGMMQLLPSTASIMARRVGVSFSASRLYDADYNMTLGSAYLGQLVDRFSGSYVMAAAGYNAGPGRPAQWASFCGDPRGGLQDPLDFIECIPFSETRNYVMRVLENLQVYRAKMRGGSTPVTLTADLKRGAYSYQAANTASSGSAP
jgi:soluble lytic murein transglycosylase